MALERSSFAFLLRLAHPAMANLMPASLFGNGLGLILLFVAISTMTFDLYLQSSRPNCSCNDQGNAALLGTNKVGRLTLQDILPRDQDAGREFRGYGCAAHVYVELGAYRVGNRSFAVVGLASKPLHTFGSPSFGCSWIAINAQNSSVEGRASVYYTDYHYGRVYKVVSVICAFEVDIGTDGNGGQLILDAFVGDTFGTKERIVALTEKPGDYKWSNFAPPYRYEFLYCGSPLYGDINPKRIREWLAYHGLVFGPRSHFVFYDAGGINDAVREVLNPWIKLGRVTVENVRQQSQYDGYYYNQFLIVADCLHRTRFLANWTFFFDIDEYIYFEPPKTIHDVFARYSDSAQVLFTQYRISDKFCAIENNSASSKWAMEKLAYHIVTSQNVDVKMALNPRKVTSAGVHWAIAYDGPDDRCDASVGRYYHYHNTVTTKGEVCREFLDHKQRWNISDGEDTLIYDGSMIPFAEKAKQLEQELFTATDPAALLET
ncbi:hypothetical protein O6H91_07G106700 [Diphasiastrum complanatum]|uniref:Uncharacterized protein n=3 Tax=Diphasiastrum complanatum TaxID=34168 RepID=A0ACC2D8C3_DIPCM|nr:hypothetical protein O6H91_Y109100 [Diphasiastrum complanatum]KAJ7296646.1 hypothetical protein O6H91_Y109100 [Diphasiastrum complanatum]KAJ7550561.1 hypothetical protein O6H91_07G106400 [Diphasiastrum complanatum]KAJ7550562.1 hypothetical protein O6H91_07G106400 [Diphasiastrum complanatum]KAJ7550568.1 hypothetical protein O6H91_07G106700 [Diphasiastrum complanatum]